MKTKKTQEQNKSVGKLGWFMSDINRYIPTTRRCTRGELYRSYFSKTVTAIMIFFF